MNTLVLLAATALGGFGGSVELPEADLSFSPVLFGPGGERPAFEKAFANATVGAHPFLFLPDTERPCAYLAGHATLKGADGTVTGSWQMAKPLAKGVRAALVGAFFLPRYDEAVFEAEGKRVVFSPEAAFGGCFDRSVRACRVADAAGKTVAALSFPVPTRVELRKERDWGLSKYELRLYFATEEGLSATLAAANALDFREQGPEKIAAGRDWVPLHAAIDVEEGSPLDFTRFRGTDSPAGRHGRIVAKDGRFEFERLPGVPQRFYGINVCFTANTPAPKDAKRFAAIIRKLGYNAIRFHHHESCLVKQDAARGSTELDPKAMARFDTLVAACIENGIYMTTDLFVSRAPVSYRSVGIDRDGTIAMNEYKALALVHEGTCSNFLAYARNFLGHVNPLTGRRYADEPAMSLLSFINEGNLCGTQWCVSKYLKDRSRPAIAAYERRFAERVTKFLRDEMRSKVLTTNLNNYFWIPDAPGEVVRAQCFDYADDHFYVDHPRFFDKIWELPSRCPNTNPLTGTDLGTQRLAVTRPWGLPFTITEYNFTAPGRFRGVGGILTGAVAARQDWGGLLRFCWTHGDWGLTHAKPLSYFDMAGDPLGLAAERASICLFLRRDLEPAKKSCVFVMPPEKAKLPEDAMPKWWPYDWAAWHVKLGTYVGERTPAGVEALATYPDAPAKDVAARLRAEPTGGIAIDPKRGTFAIDVPRTAGGFAESGALEAGPLAVDLGNVAATVWASSLDGAPIASSKRLLLTHLTDVQNAGATYADAGRCILLGWGRLPHLMRAGRASVSLALAPGAWRVWALSGAGRRVREVESAFRGGHLSFTAATDLDPNEATYLYELAAD